MPSQHSNVCFTQLNALYKWSISGDGGSSGYKTTICSCCLFMSDVTAMLSMRSAAGIMSVIQHATTRKDSSLKLVTKSAVQRTHLWMKFLIRRPLLLSDSAMERYSSLKMLVILLLPFRLFLMNLRKEYLCEAVFKTLVLLQIKNEHFDVWIAFLHHYL